MKNCNECGVWKCNPGKKYVCKQFREYKAPGVPLVNLVSKVTVKGIPKTLRLFKKYI